MCKTGKFAAGKQRAKRFISRSRLRNGWKICGGAASKRSSPSAVRELWESPSRFAGAGFRLSACRKLSTNDLAATELTFGFMTAIDIATEALSTALKSCAQRATGADGV